MRVSHRRLSVSLSQQRGDVVWVVVLLFDSRPCRVYPLRVAGGAFSAPLRCLALQPPVRSSCEVTCGPASVERAHVSAPPVRSTCLPDCKLLFRYELTSRNNVHPWRPCTYCSGFSLEMLHSHYGGRMEEFCKPHCMSQYTVLYYGVRTPFQRACA